MSLIEDSLYNEMDGFRHGHRGVLKLGVTPSLPDITIERIIARFCGDNPGLTCQMYEVNTGGLVDMLEQGIIEVALIRTPTQIPVVLDVMSTIDERFYAFSHPTAPWLRDFGGEITLKDLSSIPLSLPRGFSVYFTECCRQQGFDPVIKSVNTSRNATLMWAEQCLAVSILSQPSAEAPDGPGLSRRLITDGTLVASRSLVSVRGKSLSYAARQFAQATSRTLSPDD